MMKKLAELTIKKSADWNNEVIKALEKEQKDKKSYCAKLEDNAIC